jgi:glycine betaine/choline ABC-type transport system substrate-binding protein
VAALKNNEVQVVELFSSDGNVVENKLTTNAISKLNLDVTSKQEQPAAVAQAWLSSVGG